MKTLLVHPDDNPEAGPWVGEKWSRIVDLGVGGFETYERWQHRFGCPVLPIDRLRHGLDEIYQVRQLIDAGKGRLVDRAGIDWWETLAGYVQWQLEKLVLMRRLIEQLEPNEEVHTTRRGFYADALQLIIGGRLRVVASRAERRRGPERYLQLAKNFRLWQLAQIFWDKYDPALEFRRHFAHKAECRRDPVVLVPSAYISVTRTASAYATTAARLNFLMVAARRSARAESLPPNMKAEWLTSYAKLSSRSVKFELPEMLKKWELLRSEIPSEPELAMALRLGLFDDMPKRIRAGMHQRAAWEVVFSQVNVMSVLCADDTNPWTRVPLLLAKKFGVPAISCHHGALDVQAVLKETAADIVLAKGKMEQDYLVRVCRVPAEKVEIGAPSIGSTAKQHVLTEECPTITLFSEPYEIFGGRGEEFYRDLLPHLVVLARKTGRRLVVKLHPAESENERRDLIRSVLSKEDIEIVDVVSGAMPPDLLRQSWFGITVLSTVASECAAAGVPCFLCRWLEFAQNGYLDQFVRFGAGYKLKSPSEIAMIPRLIAEGRTSSIESKDNLFTPIECTRLEELLTRKMMREAHVAETHGAR